MTTFAELRRRQMAARIGERPHEDFPPAVKRALVVAIGVAWSRVRRLAGDHEKHGSPLALSEPELTALVQEELNHLRGSPDAAGHFGSLFETVARDASVVSADYAHTEKQPDLTFRLLRRAPGRVDAPGRALFVECKIVDSSHPVSRYGAKGIRRYVDGEYAGEMPSAMMLGYAGRGFTVSKTLTPYLRRSRKRGINGNNDPHRTRSLPALDALISANRASRVYASEHDRAWTYPEDGRAPGAITLYHLWLSE